MSKTAARKNIPVKKRRKTVHVQASGERRKEWRFDLPLKAKVAGKLPRGEKFTETSKLENISSGGAYFCLDSGVVVGSKLNLLIDLPKKATEGRKLKLQIGGITVRLEKPDKKTRKQGVAVRFHKRFKFVRSA
jgi:c-di-GMP-binding flagellar brake protein YcgR